MWSTFFYSDGADASANPITGAKPISFATLAVAVIVAPVVTTSSIRIKAPDPARLTDSDCSKGRRRRFQRSAIPIPRLRPESLGNELAKRSSSIGQPERCCSSWANSLVSEKPRNFCPAVDGATGWTRGLIAPS